MKSPGNSTPAPENLSTGSALLNSSFLQTLLTLIPTGPINLTLLHLDIETAVSFPPCCALHFRTTPSSRLTFPATAPFGNAPHIVLDQLQHLAGEGARGAGELRGLRNHKAVSMTKCNKVKFIGPVGLEVKSAYRKEEFSRALPAQRFAGPGIEFPGDVIEV